MIKLLKKAEQYQGAIFGGRLRANKPVTFDHPATEPYSNIMYWSHSAVNKECEFPLHPHEGFEIMTFILEGMNEHYDTATQVWTPLQAGDFQVIQSNSGVSHREKIREGTRAFQIWFDPNFKEALTRAPSYTDYHFADLKPVSLDAGITQIDYIGGTSPAVAISPGLKIWRYTASTSAKTILTLDKNATYSIYAIRGNVKIGDNTIEENDFIKLHDLDKIEIEMTAASELFFIQSPTIPAYKPIWLQV